MLLCRETVTKLICLISEHIDQVTFLTIFFEVDGSSRRNKGLLGFDELP